MAHNGSRLQVNPWFMTSGHSFPFMNHWKTGQNWTLVDNSGAPSPDTLNTNGYPTSITNGGVYTVFFIPLQSQRPGNWVIGWDGGATIGRQSFSKTNISGSNTNLSGGVWNGSQGRQVILPTGNAANVDGRIDIGITAIDTSNPITNIWFVHANDESRFLAGETFTDKFKERVSVFGAFRALNWQTTNTSGLRYWADRTPVAAVSYNAGSHPAGLFKGTTTNSGDDYTIAGVGAPADKDAILVKFNASASGTSPTLNGISIRGPYGDTLFGSEKPLINRYGRLTYDADLNLWFKRGGDSSVLDAVGFEPQVPFEVMVDLCNELGMHPWFHVPMWALDPLTDFATGLATYCRDNLDAGLIPRFEADNEVWNSASGFYATRYGWAKASQRWGSVQDSDNWYGRVVSLMGEAISSVYGDDRTRYRMLCGVHTDFATGSQIARMESTRHVADGGGNTPASDWVTHVHMANYFSPTLTATQELQLAWDYNQGSAPDAPEQLIDSLSVNAQFGVPYVANKVVAWKAWAAGYGAGLTFYEGGYSPDYLTADMTASISGATKAAQCVLTITSSNKPPAGSSVSISGVGGMTELNGNTYTVVGVVGNAVTINVNSAGFTTYTSGGSATYVNSRTMRNTLRTDSKDVAALETWLRRMFNVCILNGEFPSVYALSGSSAAWPVLDPDIFVSPDPPQWIAIEDVATSATPIRFTVTLT